MKEHIPKGSICYTTEMLVFCPEGNEETSLFEIFQAEK